MSSTATKSTWRYEPATKTIRSVPENYWIATMDSWDGAVNHEADAALIVAAVNSFDAAKAALRALIAEVEQLAPQSSRAGVWSSLDRAKSVLAQMEWGK